MFIFSYQGWPGLHMRDLCRAVSPATCCLHLQVFVVVTMQPPSDPDLAVVGSLGYSDPTPAPHQRS